MYLKSIFGSFSIKKNCTSIPRAAQCSDVMPPSSWLSRSVPASINDCVAFTDPFEMRDQKIEKLAFFAILLTQLPYLAVVCNGEAPNRLVTLGFAPCSMNKSIRSSFAKRKIHG